jgi:hypothetical protein
MMDYGASRVAAGERTLSPLLRRRASSASCRPCIPPGNPTSVNSSATPMGIEQSQDDMTIHRLYYAVTRFTEHLGRGVADFRVIHG